MLFGMRATCKRLSATPIIAQSTYDKFCAMLHKANITTNHVWPDSVTKLSTCHSFDAFWPLFTPYFHFNNQQLTTFGDVLIDDYLSSVILDYSAHMNLVLTVNAVNQLNAIFHNHFTLRRFARQLQFQEFAIPTSLTALTTETSMQSNATQNNIDDQMENENCNNDNTYDRQNEKGNKIHSCHATLDFLEAQKTGLRKRDIAGTSFQITPLPSGQSPLGWKFSHFIGALHLTFGPHAVQCMLEHTYALSGTGNLPHVAAQLLIQLVKEFSASNVTEALLAAQGIPARFMGKTRTLPGSIDNTMNTKESESCNTSTNNNSTTINNSNITHSASETETETETEVGLDSHSKLCTETNENYDSINSISNREINKENKYEQESNISVLSDERDEHCSAVANLSSSTSTHLETEASEFVIVSGFDEQNETPLEQQQQQLRLQKENGENNPEESHTLDYLTKLIEAAVANGSTLSSTQLAHIMQRYSSLPPSLLEQLACKDLNGGDNYNSLAEGPGLINYIDTWKRRTNALISRQLEPPLEDAIDDDDKDGWLTRNEQRQYATGPAFTHSVDFTLSSSFSDEYGIRHPEDGKIVGYCKFKKDVRDPLFYDKMSDMRNGVPFDTNGEPLHTYLEQFYHRHLRLFEVSLLVGPEEGNKVIGRAIATRYTVAREAVCRAFIIAVLRDVYRVNEKRYNSPYTHTNHSNENSENNGKDDGSNGYNNDNGGDDKLAINSDNIK